MALNKTEWVQSTVDLNAKGKVSKSASYRNFFPLANYLTTSKKALILGMGGGGSAFNLLRNTDFKIDAVEIDDKVVQVAKKYFELQESERLKIHIQDAKIFIDQTSEKFGYIEVDLYSGGPDVPFYLATQEFFTQLSERLTEDGLVIMNVLGKYQSANGSALIKTIGNTYLKVFPKVYVLPLQFQSLVIAMKKNLSLAQVKEKLVLNGENEMAFHGRYMSAKLLEHKFDRNFMIFTDNLAPIERITQQTIGAIIPGAAL